MPPKINSGENYSLSNFQDSRVLDFHHFPAPSNSVWHPPFWKGPKPHCWGFQHKEANESQKVETQRKGFFSLWNISTFDTGTILPILLRGSSLCRASYYNNLLTRFNPHWHQKKGLFHSSRHTLSFASAFCGKGICGRCQNHFQTRRHKISVPIQFPSLWLLDLTSSCPPLYFFTISSFIFIFYYGMLVCIYASCVQVLQETSRGRQIP